MALAEKLRMLRDERGLSLDEVAKKAEISKTYLWELERDTAGEKKPSAAVLLRIANALGTTLAQLLSLQTVQAAEGPVELPPSLLKFAETMKSYGTELSESDLRDLAATKFRGAQPETVAEWHQLFLLLDNSARRREP